MPLKIAQRLLDMSRSEVENAVPARVRAPVLALRQAILEAPLIGRAPNAHNVKPNHTETIMVGGEAVGFDPRLISSDDLITWLELDTNLEPDPKRMRRLIGHAERVRCDKEWPSHLEDYITSVMSISPWEVKLDKLEVGSDRYVRTLRQFMENSRTTFRHSKHYQWWRENKHRFGRRQNKVHWRRKKANERRRRLRKRAEYADQLPVERQREIALFIGTLDETRAATGIQNRDIIRECRRRFRKERNEALAKARKQAPRVELSEEEERRIASDPEEQKVLARKYGLPHSLIAKVCKKHKHLRPTNPTHKRKLTDEQVEWLRARPHLTLRAAAEELGVSTGTIHNTRRRMKEEHESRE